LEAVAVTPGVAVGRQRLLDEEQMDNVVANEHVQVLIPPDAGKRDTPRPGWDGGAVHIDAPGARDRLRRRATDDER
jgi:hypothetical protein